MRDAVALLVLGSRALDVLLLARDRDTAATRCAVLEAELRGELEPDDTVPVTYWTLTATGHSDAGARWRCPVGRRSPATARRATRCGATELVERRRRGRAGC